MAIKFRYSYREGSIQLVFGPKTGRVSTKVQLIALLGNLQVE